MPSPTCFVAIPTFLDRRCSPVHQRTCASGQCALPPLADRLTILAIAFAFAATVVAGQGTDATIVQNSTPDKFQTIPNVPKCLTAAVQQGDPAKGPSVLLIKGTAGCKAPWHWHTPNEQLMMVSGRGQVEMKGQQPVVLRAGGFAAAPGKHPHELTCIGGGCEFFLHSDAPFDIHYIDQNGKENSPEQALGLQKK